MNIHIKRRIIISTFIIFTIIGICLLVFGPFSEPFKKLILSIVLFNGLILLEILLSFLFYRDEWKDDNWKKENNRI